ncbi:MAG: hypothetical protein KME17_04975 [Cyanosarcina radialis HA8281-LM2]|nr:hypothetical protein [Cyanosarcina radialis HA8281-LM2]
MAVFLYPIYTAIGITLMLWTLCTLQPGRIAETVLLLLFVIAGIIYDNSIVSLGWLIGEGPLLKFLNRLRFLFHNLLVPLLVVVAVNLARGAGVVWANTQLADYSSWAIALLLMGFGVVAHLLHEELIPISFAGTVVYKPKSCIPIPAILTTLLLAIAGIYIWQADRCFWVFAGTMLVFFSVSLPNRIASHLLSSVAEIGLMMMLLATEIGIHGEL